MKAKSIIGNSIEEIQRAVQEGMADHFQPTLAFVFLTAIEDIDAVVAMLDASNITIFGVSTSEKFSEKGLEPDGIVLLLLDMNPAHFKLVLKDYNSATVFE